MADNITLDPGEAGSSVVTAEITWSGDTAHVQGQFPGIISGSAESYVFTLIVGGAGEVTGGVQRVTLASDDPAVALLTTIDVDTSKIPSLGTGVMTGSAPFTLATDDTQFGAVGAASDVDGNVHGQLRYIGETVNTIDGKITACNTGAVVLATGSAAIGKLAANDGVDIGNVDVTSVVPGTGATNLGKAIDSAVGATDTGIALLGKHSGDNVHVTTANGDYEIVTVSDFGALNTAPEQHHTFDGMDSTSGWSALNTDTLNLATTKKHVLGTDALTFDKVDGDANTVFAMIQKTVSSVDIGDISPHDIIQTSCYLSSLANVSYVFVRIGTSISHYNEWRVDVADLTAATFETLALSVGDPSYAGITGNGWNPSAITWIAVGVAFDAETRALAGIVFDEVSFHTNQHTSATLNAEVSSSVSSSNINVQKVGNKVVNTQGGNIGTGTQRVVLATDSPGMAVLGTATYTEASTTGVVAGAVRNDDLATLADTDNEIAPLQADEEGALYVTQAKGIQANASGVAASGTTAMVAALASRKVTIHALFLKATSATATNVHVATTTDTDVIGNAGNPIPLAVDADGDNDSGFVLPYNPAGWTTTSTANEALNLILSAAQDVIWMITYSYVP